jgi:hypothetical protein
MKKLLLATFGVALSVFLCSCPGLRGALQGEGSYDGGPALVSTLQPVALASWSSQDGRGGSTLHAPPLAGGRLAITPSTPAMKGKVTISWKHDPDKTPTEDGPEEPIDITFEMEPSAGESMKTFLERVQDAVAELRSIFPPNVGPETP